MNNITTDTTLLSKKIKNKPEDSRENVKKGHSSPMVSFMTDVLYTTLKPDLILKLIYETLGLTPNGLTVIGLIVSMLSAVLFAFGNFLAGAIVLLISVLCDVFDGLIAKKYNKTSQFGALLDSAIDRYIEIFQLAGIVFYFNSTGQLNFSYIAIFYILGSISTSYIKAKIEILKIKCEVGFFQRLERMLIFIVCAALSYFSTDFIFWGTLIVAIGANITAIQRLLYGRKMIKKAEK